MAAGAAYVEEFSAYAPTSISSACRQWSRKQARWPTLSELLEQVEDIEADAQRKPIEEKPREWHRLAEEALGLLADCYCRRVSKLEPEAHERFGRELADYVSGMQAPAENAKIIERWADEWLGVTWWGLMGPAPEPISSKGAWKRPSRPLPDMTGRERVVVEPEQA